MTHEPTIANVAKGALAARMAARETATIATAVMRAQTFNCTPHCGMTASKRRSILGLRR
jgi:hypothetical protein